MFGTSRGGGLTVGDGKGGYVQYNPRGLEFNEASDESGQREVLHLAALAEALAHSLVGRKSPDTYRRWASVTSTETAVGKKVMVSTLLIQQGIV